MASSLVVATTSIRPLPHETFHQYFWPPVLPFLSWLARFFCFSSLLATALKSLMACCVSLLNLPEASAPLPCNDAMYLENSWIMSPYSSLIPSGFNNLYSFFKYSWRYISGFVAALKATVNRNRVFSILSKFSSNQSPPGLRNSMCPSLTLIDVYFVVTPEWIALLAAVFMCVRIFSRACSTASGRLRMLSRIMPMALLA